jgi:hypothetical protein
MTKWVTIAIREDVHAALVAWAESEGITVEALLAELAEARDPRLSDSTSRDRRAEWVRVHGSEFADAFPEEEPDAMT